MLGRLVHKADFERLLAARARVRSAHFALHHISGGPLAAERLQPELQTKKLSTDAAPSGTPSVDNSSNGCWFGCIVPKRHARRAVTRNLLKRQMRASFGRHAARLPGGLWLVRLREGFAAAEFISARSPALAQAARSELDGLLSKVL